MANNKNEQTEVIEVSKGEKFVQDNGKLIGYAAIAIIVVFGAFIGYRSYDKSQNEKALNSEALMEAQFNFDAQQYEAALEGFEAVISEFGSTNVGNTAKGYAGLCAKNLGNNEEAVKYLKDFSGSDKVIAPMFLSALGDSQVALDDYAAAAKSFEKAAELSSSDEFSPTFLKKAGLCYEKLGDNAKALKAYEAIKNNYPASDLASSIEKYIIRVQ